MRSWREPRTCGTNPRLLFAAGTSRFSVALLLLTVGCAATSPPPPPGWDALREELIGMGEKDQELRQQLVKGGVTDEQLDEGLLESIQTLDRAHTTRMKEILDEHGWPARSVVGEEAATAAFLLVQHADRDPGFQRQALGLLRAAYESGEAAGWQLAYLTDRVRTQEGKPQLYGTQSEVEGGVLVLRPIEDAANVDERRTALGLPPLAEGIEQLSRVYGLPVRVGEQEAPGPDP